MIERAHKYTNRELVDVLAQEARFDTPGEHFVYGPYGMLATAARRIEQLENEVNAVEWMNGCIEKELFECRKKS